MSASDQTSPDGRIASGRKTFILIALAIALIGGAALAYRPTEIETLKFCVLLLLLFAAWQGQQWAIALLAMGSLITAIASFALGLRAGHAMAFTIGTLLAAFYGAVFLVFLKSENLNFFLKHRAAMAAKRREEEREYYN